MRSTESIIRRFGETARVIGGERPKSFRAIIQPLRYKFKTYYPNLRLPTGYYDSGHYLLLAETGAPISDYMCEIECGGHRYSVRNCGVYKLRGKNIYVWAVLTACTPETEDDYEQD